MATTDGGAVQVPRIAVTPFVLVSPDTAPQDDGDAGEFVRRAVRDDARIVPDHRNQLLVVVPRTIADIAPLLQGSRWRVVRQVTADCTLPAWAVIVLVASQHVERRDVECEDGVLGCAAGGGALTAFLCEPVRDERSYADPQYVLPPVWLGVLRRLPAAVSSAAALARLMASVLEGGDQPPAAVFLYVSDAYACSAARAGALADEVRHVCAQINPALRVALHAPGSVLEWGNNERDELYVGTYKCDADGQSPDCAYGVTVTRAARAAGRPRAISPPSPPASPLNRDNGDAP